MKLAKSLLTLSVLAMASSAVMACEKANVEAYAHPTMFNSSAVETQATRGVYLVGDKMLAAANEAIQGKENVLIDAEANALADDWAAIYGKAFNFKAPALRSEMAHALSQALGLKTPAKNKYTYKDVAGHKLQSYIYKVGWNRYCRKYIQSSCINISTIVICNMGTECTWWYRKI